MSGAKILIMSVLLSGTSIAFATGFNKDGNSVTVSLTHPSANGAKCIRLSVVNDNIIRVEASPDNDFPKASSLIIVPQQTEGIKYNVSEIGNKVWVKAKNVSADVDKGTGRITFYDAKGNILLNESQSGKTFSRYVSAQTQLPDGYKPSAPGEVNWGKTDHLNVISEKDRTSYSWHAVFDSPNDEAFYGLGQHQSDEFNYKGRNEELFQYNTKVSVPFVVSNKNYGLLFDSYSLMRFGDERPYSQIGKVFKLYDDKGQEGALTGTYVPKANSGESTFVRREDSLYFADLKTIMNLPKNISLYGSQITYSGSIEAPQTGDYHFILYYAGYMKLYADGKLIVPERWRTAWNPNSYKFVIKMKAGEKLPIRIEWKPDGGASYCALRALSPISEEEQNKLSVWAEMQDDIDYYFIASTNIDGVISGYRTLTGKSPIMPKWAMGYWQSRDRYTSTEDVLSTFGEFRKRNIPIDNIVQDWSYWKEDSWGSQEFDRSRYPDPKAMMDSVHAMHGRLMISVWPKYYPTTANFKELNDKGYMYQQALKDSVRDWISTGYLGSFYDAYAKNARDIFWKQMNRGLYSKGVDAWWMDASEPDILSNADIDYRKQLCGPTVLGPSDKYFNTYALMNAKGIYEGQRSVNPNNRVFLLTRSGFAGLQRYSTATWSGDIGSRWEDMRAQMSAGLNYALSGIPYWTMDIGGYCTEDRYTDGQNLFNKTGEENEDLKEWRELNSRWHQFASFVPLYRSHGKFPLREPWNIAPAGHPAYESILYYDRLRYRLMPYIYTMAGMTYFKDYTIMRALVMDFTSDSQVNNIKDQWMFGQSLMVCPVGYYKARSREVYFPKQCGWYDLYTGKRLSGGQTLTVDAPYEKIPVFVREGSIVPFGPAMEWSDGKKPELINLYVYEGADATFQLYEDEGTNYNYEKGKSSTIDFNYNEKTHQLTIGDRKGSFDGMLQDRRFNIVVVSAKNAQALNLDSPAGKMVKYNGKQIKVTL